MLAECHGAADRGRRGRRLCPCQMPCWRATALAKKAPLLICPGG